ncbi:MAG: DUF4336 domain-containing protein [bacterium]
MTHSNQLYQPIYTLKPFAENVFIVDGQTVDFYGLPFTTRMTVVKLTGGDLFIHSPIPLKQDLKEELDKLGRVKYLIAPNKIHYWYLDRFQKAYPEAITFAAKGVKDRAKQYGKNFMVDYVIEDAKNEFWSNEIDHVIMHGNRFMEEVEFYHKPSKTLILTDIYENFEPHKIGLPFRILAWLGGALSPKGGTTRDQQLLYSGHKKELQKSIEKLKSWDTQKIILAHGKCITENAKLDLERVFGWVR